MKYLTEKTKNLGVLDIAFTKLAVIFFVVYLFSVWPGFRLFIDSINPFVFLFGWIVFALKPLYKFFK